MIKVCQDEYGDKVYLTVEGHSGYGKKGEDIVCAGVSSLVCTLINCLKNEEKAGRIKILKSIVREGFVCLELEYFDCERERITAITETIIFGLYMLSEKYPQYIKID